MRRLVAVAALLLVAAMAIGGCGSNSQPSGPLPTKIIDITVSGDDVTPSGATVDVAVGQRIEFRVTADAPGEIHVHSSPDEQEFQYDTGSSTLQVKPIQAPGIIPVESHTLGKVILKLQAR